MDLRAALVTMLLKRAAEEGREPWTPVDCEDTADAVIEFFTLKGVIR